MAKRKKNYLNNKDMLKEIHLSKISYCSFADPVEDNQQDFIVESVAEISGTQNVQIGKDDNGEPIMGDVPVIDLARQARAARLTKLDIPTDVDDVTMEDVVFRVMTDEHIPRVPKKKSKALLAKEAKQAKANAIFDELMDPEDEQDEQLSANDPNVELMPMRVTFPPFFHYRIHEIEDRDNSSVAKLVHTIVGKSHWVGDLETGHFSKDHGRTTDNLAMMYIKLCERYGTRSNWRGYCVDSATEALTDRGWLSENKITENDKILSFDGSTMVWSNINSIFRDNYHGLMHKLTSRSIDSLITPNHKIVTDKGLVKIEYLKESDRVVVMGDAVPTEYSKTYDDKFVELAGWIISEGDFQMKKKIVTIYQNEGPYADRIRDCLHNLNFTFSEVRSAKSENIAFAIKRKHWDEITELLPNKNLTMDFILKLTRDQRELLVTTMTDGVGHRNGLLMQYTQQDKTHMDHFQTLCALIGLKSNVHYIENKMSFGKPVSYYVSYVFAKRGNHTRGACIDMHGGKDNGKEHIGKGKFFHPNKPTTQYNGTVWCPETDYGCFLARRNSKVYLTGNTYNDEMQGQALLQLSQIGLQFNELKSQNPFAYYTAAVTNSFTRVLNIEKKMQNIRDDILESNGLTPSWTRQYANDAAKDILQYDYNYNKPKKDAGSK